MKKLRITKKLFAGWLAKTRVPFYREGPCESCPITMYARAAGFPLALSGDGEVWQRDGDIASAVWIRDVQNACDLAEPRPVNGRQVLALLRKKGIL